MRTIAVFASGTGSNCENIIRYFADSEDVRVGLVLCNKADAPVVEKARQRDVPTVIMGKKSFNDPASLLPILREHGIELIVLAGFLLMIPDYLLAAFPRAVINIHPSLLPKYGGKGMYGHHVYEAIWEHHEKETGMTVHWVTGECDGGEIIAQYRVALSPDDTLETIATKEHELEMKHFPQVIEKVVRERFANQ